MKKLLLLTWVILLGIGSVNAQMQTWTWDTYKVKFDAPKDFKVLKNDATTFSAGNSGINLTIYPQKGKSFTKNSMASSLKDWAVKSKLTFDGAPEPLDDLNGYWGLYRWHSL